MILTNDLISESVALVFKLVKRRFVSFALPLASSDMRTKQQIIVKFHSCLSYPFTLYIEIHSKRDTFI